MKKFLAVAFIALASASLFSACRRHTVVVAAPQTGSMAATANSAAINSTYCVGTSGSPVSIITASFGNNTDITFNLKAGLSAATYSLNSSGANNNAEYSVSGVPVLSKSGTITIDTVNAGINYIGSFNFTCVDGTVVSGKFTATAVK